MEKFTQLKSQVALIDRANIDTDILIPKQYLKSIKKSGFGIYLFDDWRYLDKGSLDIDNKTRRINPNFLLNQSAFNGAQILIANENFGCGSSREHAVWAMLDYGFKVVLAPSFGDIFYNNALKNGLLAIQISNQTYQKLADYFNQKAKENETFKLEIDLINQKIKSKIEGLNSIDFDIDDFRKEKIIKGEDEIDQSLKNSKQIKDFEKKHYKKYQWLNLEKIN